MVTSLPSTWQAKAAAPALGAAPAPIPVSAAPTPVAAVAAPEASVAPDVESPAAAGAPAVDPAPRLAPPVKPPSNAHEAEEAIERISATAPKPGSLAGVPVEATEGFGNNVATMRDALKMVPSDSPDFAHFNQVVDGYEAALAASGRPAAPAPQPVANPVGGGGGLPQASDETYGPTAVNPSAGMAPNHAPEAPIEDMDAPPVGFY